MPVTIDHTAYPGIIDRIIAYASPKSLKALSSTSWYFRHRILHHAVIQPKPRVRKVNPKASCTHPKADASYPTKSRSKYSPFMLATPGGQRLPFIPTAVRILDHVPGKSPYRISASAFAWVNTLRRMHGAYDSDGPKILYPTLTVVDFVPVHHSPLLRDWHDEVEIDIVMPKRTSKYVLHLRMDDVDDEEDMMVPFKTEVSVNRSQKVRDLVIVLGIPDANEHAESMISAATSAIGSVINSTFFSSDCSNDSGDDSSNDSGDNSCDDSSNHSDDGFSLTVVGLDRLKVAPRRDEFWEQIDHQLLSFDQTRELKVRDTMRFLSIDEWWEELGDRKDIEGVWPPAASHGG